MKLQSKRRYSIEFKRSSVQKSLDSPDTVKAVAASLGISHNLLSRWRREFTSPMSSIRQIENSGPEKSIKELESENRSLKKRLEKIELENDILKKAKDFYDKQRQ